MSDLYPETNKYLGQLQSFAAVADWKLTDLSPRGAEFTRKKTYSASYFVWGTALLILGGFGALLWLVGLVHYFTQRDEILFITMSELDAKEVDTEQFKWR